MFVSISWLLGIVLAMFFELNLNKEGTISNSGLFIKTYMIVTIIIIIIMMLIKTT